MSGVRAEALADYMVSRTRWLFSPGNLLESTTTRIKCEYCGVYSLELKSNCDSCGAGLPLENTAGSRLFYDPEAFNYEDLIHQMKPGQVIPIKRSFLQEIASAGMLILR